MAAGPAPEMAAGLKIQKGRLMRSGAQDHVAAPAPVPAVGDGVARPEVFIEGAAPLASPTGLDEDPRLVDEACPERS